MLPHMHIRQRATPQRISPPLDLTLPLPALPRSKMASILCNKSSFAGATKVQSAKRSVARSPLVVRAQQENVEVVSVVKIRVQMPVRKSDQDTDMHSHLDRIWIIFWRVFQSRRATLGSLAGAAALLSGVAPSMAAFGDSANVFGKVTNKTGTIPYAGEGFALVVPSKWNPSKKELQEFKGTLLR